jgi:hypothetical protein
MLSYGRLMKVPVRNGNCRNPNDVMRLQYTVSTGDSYTLKKFFVQWSKGAGPLEDDNKGT